ncbi:M23 family metallopeptidase [Streptomyces sp. NBC_01239]|uniref:M23 family metallopeptidase n=1 Tax=Streptomyces sp. NBC_01239 TaxID=2903792 RepID=UPI00225AD014|nr:M23 family metallopeptidase [Streptomyces sp. NBC_01239]MCX4812988.1 M23 family metallopeptidase [Streptomyces sp. NBC_01239]
MTPEQYPPQRPEADALLRFLTAAPVERPRLAPRVADAVGVDTLERIVQATLTRTGRPVAVTDSPDGLLVTGEEGQVRAWARAAPDGGLAALYLEGARRTPPRGRRLRVPYGLLMILVAVANVIALWTAPDRTAWCTDLTVLAVCGVLVEGLGAPAQQPRLPRRTVEAGTVVATVASASRLPELPTGHGTLRLSVAVVVLVALLGAVAAGRTRTWRAPLSQPLRFPLEGVWYVVQGGARPLNHHAGVPEQRGAVDLAGLGRYGSRTRGGHELTAFAAYGRAVRAPCDGRVVSAEGAIEDQEAGPGARARYQPPYGNHVFIDTGREIVKLAHLRAGSLTVSRGDTVRAGQLVGETGNSGNTTEPHLHLHAERDGVGLDLRFTDVPGRLYRGRVIRTFS